MLLGIRDVGNKRPLAWGESCLRLRFANSLFTALSSVGFHPALQGQITHFSPMALINSSLIRIG